MEIDLATLLQLERLAALDTETAPAGAREKLCDDLSRVLDHVRSLTSALSAAPETAPAPETVVASASLRADEPQPGLSREAALRGAPHTDGLTFVVPRIVP